MKECPALEVVPTGRATSGVLLLDKQAGISSQAAVTRVKRLLGVAKAGHTGTLDPLATGLLPICIGEATKFSHLLLEAEKTYEASIRLGVVTTTGDREGETISVSPVRVDVDAVREVLARFVGEIAQVPPMYSALKHQGQPLYKLAREGICVPRAARTVRVRSLELHQLAGDMLHFRIVCGKGTYIRVLAEDVGRALQCGASLDNLRRTAVGALSVNDGATIEMLESLPREARARHVLTADTPVAALPRVDVEPAQARSLMHGRAFQGNGCVRGGLVRLYDRPSGRFLGVGTLDATGLIAPRRLMSTPVAADIA
ncbi:MAG: tRNA pseudouridine(55) synthase TruB [Betaproteobacteria bacterium]|nr:tRNA pseudouridine(55) synthase TruB [Betaproteobacteria bacterium]